MDNKEAVAEAEGVVYRGWGPSKDLTKGLLDALEAAEAELTRQDTVIANALAAIECVPLMDDRYGTGPRLFGATAPTGEGAS